MPGKASKLSLLAARKRLLLLESEVNRQQLLRDLQHWKSEFESSRQELSSLGSMASLTTKLAATFAAAGHTFSTNHGTRSWMSRLLSGATTGTSLWFLVRSIRKRMAGG